MATEPDPWRVTPVQKSNELTQYIEPAAAPAIGLRADQASGAAARRTEWVLPGFGPLTPVETDHGPYPSQALRVRDRVRLRSGRFCPIVRVDRYQLDEAFLEHNEDAQPVLVPAGRLGYGLPKAPMLLSPGQKLSVGSASNPMFHTARDLLDAGIAFRRPERFLTYVVFSFEEPEDVCSNGLWLRVEPPAVPHGDLDS
jgi:hypothetical protein